MESNDSPEIPDKVETSEETGLPSGQNTEFNFKGAPQWGTAD